jgi:hypothetical protein
VRRCRPAICVALAATATLGSLAVGGLPAQAASADTDPGITIVSVSSPGGNVGQLTVVTESASPITSLTVHLVQGSTDLTVSDFNLPGTGTGQQTYVVQNPLTSTDPTSADFLPPGTYAATVDASDTAGDPDPQASAGQFPFLIQPTVTLAESPASINYGHQTVTFSGAATGVWPGATTAQPLPQVRLSIDGPGGPSTTTDAGGDFTVAAKVTPGSFQAVIPSTPAIAGSGSALVQVSGTTDPVALTAALAKKTVRYNQTDSVSGTVTYQPDPVDPAGPFVPLAGTTVTIQGSAPGSKPITTVTNASGDFTATLPKQTATGTWTVSAGGGPLLEQQQKTLTLHVQLPTAFRQVSISLNAFRQLSIKACLNVTSPGGSEVATDPSVTLQYARSAKGPWKKLQTVKPLNGIEYCKSGPTIWQSTATAPVANGYYRLSFAGNSGLESASGSAHHRWRYQTKITSFKITPRTVAAQGTVTVSGRLWRHTKSWHPDTGRKVVVLFRYQGQWFFYTHEPKTNSRGYFSGLFTVFVTSKWIAQYNGDKTHYASATKQLKVTATSGGNSRLIRGARPTSHQPGLHGPRARAAGIRPLGTAGS